MTPKIRHLAIMCMDPQKLAEFYRDVFEMKIVGSTEAKDVYVSDGYITLALLKQKAVGKSPGLNHFGIHIEDHAVIAERLKKWNVIGPEKRPPDRAYAETRAPDPEGNNYDLAVGGFDRDKSKPKKDHEVA
jgi:catechol 2,3-dioxygenase-like lactoylglutathione lyase family enzyme